MNYLLKQRRLFATLVTILCVIYSSHVTIQIMAGVSQHQECFHVNDDATRHIMTKNYKMDEIVASLTRDDLSDGNESPTRKENRSYRLDIVKDDLAKISENNNGAEAEEEIRTNYFSCADFDRIPRTRKEVEENLRGNRAISFIKVRIDGVTIPAVIKEANRRRAKPGHILKWQAYKNASLYRTVIEEYKYNSAKREILYLNKLRGLKGIPRMLGSCVEDLRIRYLVERVKGATLCNDNGTTTACANGNYIIELMKNDPNPQLAALTFAYSTVTFFQQLEERHLFMEDVSGLNFMVTSEWQLYMVDADSLVFYNDSRIYSQVSCHADDHCPSPSGNLWVEKSLNVRIYENCRDLKGICEDNQCRGFGTELHTCGLAHWYMCRLGATFIPASTSIGKVYNEVCACMREMYPHRRCTFKRAAEIMKKAFGIFLQENASKLPSK